MQNSHTNQFTSTSDPLFPIQYVCPNTYTPTALNFGIGRTSLSNLHPKKKNSSFPTPWTKHLQISVTLRNMGHSEHRGVGTRSYFLSSLRLLPSNFIKYCYLSFLSSGITKSLSLSCSNSSRHALANYKSGFPNIPKSLALWENVSLVLAPSTPQSKFPFLTEVSILSPKIDFSLGKYSRNRSMRHHHTGISIISLAY